MDFDEDMVLIASAGMGSGEGMVVTNAVTLEGAVHVSVNHHLPGRNCPTLDAEEWMGQAVAIERAEGPVHVYVERHQNPPCLEEPVAALECWTATRPEQRAPSLRSIEPATIHCDASASRTDGGRGEPESWSWRMISAPEESALEPGPLGGEGPELQMEMDVAGTYAWEVTITDAQRNQAAAHGSAVKGRPEHAVAKITIAPDGGATHVLHDDRPRAAGSRMTVGTVRMPRGTFTPADRGSGTSSASASVSLAIGFGLE